jgi:hypothetical protein
MRLSRDFRELLECFVRHDVRYLIVGGWALAAHGVVRYTKDLDVWIWPEPPRPRGSPRARGRRGAMSFNQRRS